MDIQRRSLFKIVAGGALLVTSSSFLVKENDILWDLWHHLRYRVAMNAAPLRNPDIISKNQDQGTILYSQSHQKDVLKLNPMARRIWEMCDGSCRVNIMIQRIANSFDVMNSDCTRDVISAISKLQKRGLLHLS